MATISFKTTTLILSAFEKLLKVHIVTEGMEHLYPAPTLFVVNHFTRMETFILPYVLYHRYGLEVHSLADSALFKGWFGEYLESIGAISVGEPLRNRRIVSELMTGRNHWVIYPEGVMVKDKKTVDGNKFVLNTPNWKGSPHTGAAVLALKTEIYKHEYRKAVESKNLELMEQFQKRYDFKGVEALAQQGTVIVPVNITYYPIRPGENLISHVASSLFKTMSERLQEELKVEGHLLLSNTDMTIYFGEPIPVKPWVEMPLALSKKYFSFVDDSNRTNLILWAQKSRLTKQFMHEIYTKMKINIDHLVCTALEKIKADSISEEDFYRAVYLSSLEIRKRGNRQAHRTLQKDHIKAITDEVYSPLENILRLAEQEGVLQRQGSVFKINKSSLDKPTSFHEARLTNTVQVISNELEPVHKACDIIERCVNLHPETLRERIAEEVFKKDTEEFDRDYEAYYEEGLSKAPSVGRPFFMKNNSSKIGIVISHGYLAAPEEIRPLAQYLFDQGFSVYGVRMRGLGTSPRQLCDVKWEDWVHSFNRGYAVVKNSCEQVFVGGFSSGGILALIHAARKKAVLKGVFCINSPIILANIKTRLVPAALAWNDLLDKFHISKGKLEYVVNPTESPEINYGLNYIQGLRQLDQMIAECRKTLNQIHIPALVIQSNHDPVVDPKSAEIIYSKIQSKQKQFVSLERNRHVIVRQEGKEEVFEKIKAFIDGVVKPSS